VGTAQLRLHHVAARTGGRRVLHAFSGSRGSWFISSNMTEGFRGFLQALKLNTRIILQLGPGASYHSLINS
jgi:hypothetical protein